MQKQEGEIKVNNRQEKANLEDWIYSPLHGPDVELERTIANVEKALGFKLFIWQKTFIARGIFRRYGATTAEILRELLNVSAPPLDYTKRMEPRKEFYKRELREIKSKLDQAGILTRTVFFTVDEKRKYAETKSNFEDNVFTDVQWKEVDTSAIVLRDRNGNIMSSGEKNVLDTIMKIGCDLAAGGAHET